MKILIDFSSIKSGGGLQLAHNFLNELKQEKHITILINSKLKLDNKKDLIRIFTPSNVIIRFMYESTILKYKIKKRGIEKIYTFFGPGLPCSNNVYSIVTVAYPIICYPESPYWENIPFLEKLKKRVLNHFRLRRLKRANLIICETETMRIRLKRVLERSKFVLLPPSASKFIKDISIEERIKTIDLKNPKVLLLSGTAYHKNLWELYGLIKSGSNKNVSFIVSTTRAGFINHVEKIVNEKVDEKLVDRFMKFTGVIPAERIQKVYSECDALMNLSDLESFSNNYLEAWKSSLPLLCSDRDFSRGICGTSAIYFEPHNINSILDSLKVFSALSESELKCMLQEGKNLLRKTPSSEERVSKIIEIINPRP